MKKWIALSVVALMLGSALPLFAEDGTTSGTSYNTGCECIDEMLNEYLNHTHNYYIPERRFPAGLGLDLKVWGDGMYGAKVETKYDFSNEEGSVFLVGTIDLTKLY